MLAGTTRTGGTARDTRRPPRPAAARVPYYPWETPTAAVGGTVARPPAGGRHHPPLTWNADVTLGMSEGKIHIWGVDEDGNDQFIVVQFPEDVE
jgi:hypothetical protein